MRHVVVETSNVVAFKSAAKALENRAAAEACFGLVSGEPGHGKSRIGQWWANQKDAVFIRLKTRETPVWFLRELARELGETAPAHRYDAVYDQVTEILTRDPRPIVVDEVEHGLDNKAKVIEALRDVTDFVEVPALLLGREHIPGALRRHKQIWTRISARVEFGALSEIDVGLCFREMCQAEVAPEVLAAAARQSGGVMRHLLNAIKTVEAIGLARKRRVELADIAGKDLRLEFHKNRPIKSEGKPPLEVVAS